jgi:hypothetical protein
VNQELLDRQQRAKAAGIPALLPHAALDAALARYRSLPDTARGTIHEAQLALARYNVGAEHFRSSLMRQAPSFGPSGAEQAGEAAALKGDGRVGRKRHRGFCPGAFRTHEGTGLVKVARLTPAIAGTSTYLTVGEALDAGTAELVAEGVAAETRRAYAGDPRATGAWCSERALDSRLGTIPLPYGGT